MSRHQISTYLPMTAEALNASRQILDVVDGKIVTRDGTRDDYLRDLARNVDIELLRKLLPITESANPPATVGPDSVGWGEMTFDAKDGWKVVIFYDGYELDYIDSWIDPDGNPVKMDGRTFDVACRWRGVGDAEGILADLDAAEVMKGQVA